jgi:serine protease
MRRLLSFVLVVAGLVVPAAAQWLDNDPAATNPERLFVKLAEGSGAEWRDGALHSRTATDLSSVAALLEGVATAPLVTAVSWDELDRWHRQACAALPPHNRPGHLGLWLRVTAPTATAAAELLGRLRADPLVSHAYFEPKPSPASAGVAAPAPIDIPPTTPLMTHLQGSHQPAPLGHGARATAGILGARGQGLRMVMIEQSWILDHEDVSQLVAGSFLGGVAPLDMQYARHGTSGASMVCADRNGYGITGLADETEMRFIGLTLHGNIENSLALAIANTVPGDLVLAVLIVPCPVLGPDGWVPVEYFTSTFDAMLTATALGRHVVAAGGNGNVSLDDPVFLNVFNRAFRDSGAVLVGASEGGPLVRASYSNWGSRLDAHSWGDSVAACGYSSYFYPNNDDRQAYTEGAGGTSASTPQVAGVVASLLGAAKRQLGQPLTNAQLLALLHAHGPNTPDVIGRRPDLLAALVAIGAIDGLTTATPDLQLGQAMAVTVGGDPGTLVALFAGFATADVEVGLNRRAHIDPAQAISVAGFALPAGGATWTMPVPNNSALHGIDCYFQAVRLPASGVMNLTNSCQVTIL